jgi:hypothetical protein
LKHAIRSSSGTGLQIGGEMMSNDGSPNTRGQSNGVNVTGVSVQLEDE